MDEIWKGPWKCEKCWGKMQGTEPGFSFHAGMCDGKVVPYDRRAPAPEADWSKRVHEQIKDTPEFKAEAAKLEGLREKVRDEMYRKGPPWDQDERVDRVLALFAGEMRRAFVAGATWDEIRRGPFDEDSPFYFVEAEEEAVRRFPEGSKP